jgi:hypothetical protein
MLFSPVSKKGCNQTSEKDGGWGRTFFEAISNGNEYITESLIREFLIYCEFLMIAVFHLGVVSATPRWPRGDPQMAEGWDFF